MEHTLPFTQYSSQRTALDAIERQTPEDPHAPITLSGPSPFEIPQAIDAEIVSDTHVMFRFHYPNDEPPEDDLRLPEEDRAIKILLAKHTKKVLELHLLDPLRQLAVPGSFFHPRMIAEWIEPLPAEAFNAAVRNAAIVGRILSDMPDSFRHTLSLALDRP